METSITIIIPTYNAAATLEKCLNSVLNQDYKQVDVLILDSCSTDATISILEIKFRSIPTINWISEKDEGVYDAMNKGIQLAKGEWIYFMGADDYLFEGVLSTIAPLLKREKLDIFYGNVQLTSDGSKYDGEFDLHKLMCKGNICHQAIFYRRHVFTHIGNYNLNYKIWADWDLNIRCFKYQKFSIAYVDVTIACYNNESGLSSTYDPVFCQELPAYYLNNIAILEQKIFILEQEKRSLLNSKYFVLRTKVEKLLHKTGFIDLFGNNGES